VFDEQAHVSALSTSDFDRHHDVRNHQRVLKEEAFYGAVARSPIEPGEGRVVHATKVCGSTAAESVGDTPGTTVLVVVNLAGGAFDVAVVVESLQTTEHLLTAAAHEVSDLM
jgi:hypothetical protein